MRARRPLAWRIGLLLGIAVFAVLLIAGVVVNRVVAGSFQVILTDQQQQRLDDAIDTVADRLDRPLRLQALTLRLATRLNGRVEIIAPDGRLLAGAGRPPDGDSAVSQVPVVTDGATVATVRATLPARAADRGFLPLFNLTLVLAGLGCVLVIVLASTTIATRLTRPLRDVAAAARRLEAGEAGARARGGDDRESADLAAAFNAMAERLERSEVLRRRAASDIAHDLATPATVLVAQLQAMIDGVVSADRDGLEAARAAAAALGSLVGDLADLASAEAAPNTTRPEIVDIGVLAGEVVRALDGLARERAARVEVGVAPGVQAVADPGHLGRALRNVVANALVHGPEGQVVTITASESGGTTSLRVADHGPGIAAADLPHLFERFYRTDSSRAPDPLTGRRRGSGLGLTIARELLTADRGRISVERTGPDGTTFLLEVPAGTLSGPAVFSAS